MSPLVVRLLPSHPLLPSLEAIRSERQREGMRAFNPYRILSIANLLAAPGAGLTYRSKESRSPLTAIGNSDEPGSYVLDSTVEPAEDSDVDALRDKVLEVRRAAAKVIANRLERARLPRPHRRLPRAPRVSPREGGAPLQRVEANYETARNSFEDAITEASKTVKRGMLVLRWEARESKSLGARARPIHSPAFPRPLGGRAST